MSAVIKLPWENCKVRVPQGMVPTPDTDSASILQLWIFSNVPLVTLFFWHSNSSTLLLFTSMQGKSTIYFFFPFFSLWGGQAPKGGKKQKNKTNANANAWSLLKSRWPQVMRHLSFRRRIAISPVRLLS